MQNSNCGKHKVEALHMPSFSMYAPQEARAPRSICILYKPVLAITMGILINKQRHSSPQPKRLGHL